VKTVVQVTRSSDVSLFENEKTIMKPIYWFVCPALLLLLIFQPLYGAEPKEAKRVLVLYSEDKTHPAHEMTEQGIREGFRSNPLFDVQLYTEYLDVSRFGDPPYARAMADLLRRKYSGMEIHVIITVYPHALDFLLAERPALFPGVPVIAAVIGRSNAENLERSPARRFVTGTILGNPVTAVMDAALHVRPKTKHIALVAGTAPNDSYVEQGFRFGFRACRDRRIMTNRRNNIEIENVRNLIHHTAIE